MLEEVGLWSLHLVSVTRSREEGLSAKVTKGDSKLEGFFRGTVAVPLLRTSMHLEICEYHYCVRCGARDLTLLLKFYCCYLIKCVWKFYFPIGVTVHYMYAWCLKRIEEFVGSPRT